LTNRHDNKTPDIDQMTETRLASKATRPFWYALGWIAMALAAAGAVLPLLPTVPFLLVAAWAFGKSSKRWRAWIYNQPTFGPMLMDWEHHGVIPPVGKYAAVLMMLSSFAALVMYSGAPVYVFVIVGVILTTVTGFILTRPSYPPAAPAPPLPQPEQEP
jgi:uncharacterized membrane protein YbaN (DUF454 family)